MRSILTLCLIPLLSNSSDFDRIALQSAASQCEIRNLTSKSVPSINHHYLVNLTMASGISFSEEADRWMARENTPMNCLRTRLAGRGVTISPTSVILVN